MTSPRAYDAVVGTLDRLGLAGLRAELSRGLTGRVLEVGAGTGRQLTHHPAGVELTIVDPDPRALERARGRRPDAEAVVARAESLPFDDGAFDAVVAALVLCSVEDPGAALAEIRRVLRPDGRLCALEHVRSPVRAVARAQSALTPAWRRVADGCHLDRDTVGAIEAAGFAVTQVRRALGGHLVLVEATAPGPHGDCAPTARLP